MSFLVLCGWWGGGGLIENLKLKRGWGLLEREIYKAGFNCPFYMYLHVPFNHAFLFWVLGMLEKDVLGGKSEHFL